MDDTLAQLNTALAGQYLVEAELGRGGMATVYLAQDLRHDRPIALKVMRPDLASSRGAERFFREIRLAARLQHPHIMPVFDSGSAGDLLWYAMPLVEGESLRRRLDRTGPLPVEEAISIARGVAAALDYAHRHGVVHRDVKPENLLLHEGGPLLADFGIGRFLEPDSGPHLTETGLAIGTVAYMSPEQAAGDSAVDGRADIYSLGCVLYEMLGGTAPFSGFNARAALARRITQSAPPLTALRPEVPEPVARAVDRALSPAPDDRFGTAAEFGHALAGKISTEDGSRPGSIAVLPFINLSADGDDDHFSDGMTDELINALAKIEGLRVVSRTSAFAFKGLAQDVRAIGARLSVGAVVEGSVRRAGSRLRVSAQLVNVTDGYQLWSATFDRQLDDVFAIQEEIARAIVGTLRVKLLGPAEPVSSRPPTRNLTAYTCYLRGRQLWNRRTVEALRLGLTQFERALEHDPEFAMAHVGLADSYVILGFYEAMRPADAFPRARAAAERALALEPGLADAYPALAYVYMYHDWDWVAAATEFQRVLRLNPGHSTALQWYGNYLTLMGRFDEGIAAFSQAVELDPISGVKTAALGWGCYFARRYEDAELHARRALEIEPDSVVGHLWVGQALLGQREFDRAAQSFAEAARLTRRNALSLSGLAVAEAGAGRQPVARELLAEVETLASGQYVSSFNLAVVHVALGEFELAIDALERGYMERTHWMALLRVEPRLDPLRGHRRFEALLKAMAFP
ncbi:MAG: protein kinase [Gemmatimonadetes bacterium]|nr:protein kinase [Gemmatimonadota bacterium]